MSDTDSEPRGDLELHLWFVRIDPHIIIYSTIILMTAYALYSEGTQPLTDGPWIDLIAVSIAPLFALGMAHAFSEALDLQIRYQRRLNAHDRMALLQQNVQYLYVAFPPSLLLGVLVLLNWDANVAVELMLALGVVSLVFWGMFAGRKAGLGLLNQIGFGVSYGLMGVIVILVELFLTH